MSSLQKILKARQLENGKTLSAEASDEHRPLALRVKASDGKHWIFPWGLFTWASYLSQNGTDEWLLTFSSHQVAAIGERLRSLEEKIVRQTLPNSAFYPRNILHHRRLKRAYSSWSYVFLVGLQPQKDPTPCLHFENALYLMRLQVALLQTRLFFSTDFFLFSAARRAAVVSCEADANAFPIERFVVEFEDDKRAENFCRELEREGATLKIEDDHSIEAAPAQLKESYNALKAAGKLRA